MIEFCCEEDSVIGKVAADDCRVMRLTGQMDMTKATSVDRVKQVIREAPQGSVFLWSSIPCTGGSQWNVQNLRKDPSLLPKMQGHWSLFHKLWDAFVELAEACIG